MSFDLVPFGSLFSTPQKNGLTRPKSVRGSGVPMVNMNELFAFSRIHNIKMDLVPIVDKESHFFLENEDLLFARQSLVLAGAGKCSIFIGNTKPTVFESHIIRCRLNKTVSNPYFYYYFFQSVHGRIVMETIAEQGAGASGIRGSDLVKLLVPCPSKSYQDAIVKILTPLDNRISLLRETNTTLEAIAQTLFKSWFVDFDPVKAKAQGKQPEGMDEATAAFFPSEFEESALGLIPKGWRVGTLGDVARLHKGSINPLHHQNTVFEHYSLPSFDNGQSPVMEAGIEIKSNKTSVQKIGFIIKIKPHIPEGMVAK
ncbi:MAG: restriction endonuclease subunit S [Moraxellaceae bacterium]|nr:restriction endonuclease subunit S [Moraxellaceae bacterium]